MVIQKELERLRTEDVMHQRTPLYLATMENDQEEVRRLLASSPSLVNVGDANGNSPLHVAATDGHGTVADLLIQAGANVDARNNNGDTPLHRAAWQGYVDIVDLLIRHEATIDSRNKKGWTPLYSATRNTDGCRRVADLLIRHGTPVDLNSALRLQMTEYTKRTLSEAGQQAISQCALFPSMVLADAIDYTSNYGDLVDLVALLLRYMADPNGVNHLHESPLLVACRRSKMPTAVFKMLLEHGADINRLQPVSGLSAATVAQQAGNDEAASLIHAQ